MKYTLLAVAVTILILSLSASLVFLSSPADNAFEWMLVLSLSLFSLVALLIMATVLLKDLTMTHRTRRRRGFRKQTGIRSDSYNAPIYIPESKKSSTTRDRKIWSASVYKGSQFGNNNIFEPFLGIIVATFSVSLAGFIIIAIKPYAPEKVSDLLILILGTGAILGGVWVFLSTTLKFYHRQNHEKFLAFKVMERKLLSEIETDVENQLQGKH